MERYDVPPCQTAMFSWNANTLTDLALLEGLGVRTVFQEVPAERDREVSEALSAYDVYLLAGDPNMELDEMKEALVRAKRYYQGLVLDVEPYLRDEWSAGEGRAATLDAYCEQVEELHAYAQELGTEVILCIPYWYDELGFDEQLDRIARASDGMCVMNYNRGNEWKGIIGEYRLAGKYHKRLWSAYELAPSDGVGVCEGNTYHDQGLVAVRENYKANFSDTGIGLAYHDFESVREVAAQEGHW